MLDLPNRVLKAAFDRRGKDGIQLPNAAQQTGQQLLQREHIRSECFNLFVHLIEARMAAGQHGVPGLIRRGAIMLPHHRGRCPQALLERLPGMVTSNAKRWALLQPKLGSCRLDQRVFRNWHSGTLDQYAQQGDRAPAERNGLRPPEQNLGVWVETEGSERVNRRHCPIWPQFGNIF